MTLSAQVKKIREKFSEFINHKNSIFVTMPETNKPFETK